MNYFIVLIFVLCSYTIIEKLLRHFSIIKCKVQLWSTIWYYLWGSCLLLAVSIISPNDFVFKIPVDIRSIIGVIIIMLLFIFASVKNNTSVYYPKASEPLKCIHHSIVLPIFEEVAFRGIILPILIILLDKYVTIEIVLLLNGLLFALFHRNYWSFTKEHFGMYIMFLLDGYLLSYVTYSTQSILMSVFTHIMINGGITAYKNFFQK